MILTASSNEGRDRGCPDALPHVAHEIHEPGGSVGFFRLRRPTYPASVRGTNRKATGMYCHTRKNVAERKLISRSTCLLRNVHGYRETYPTKGYDVTRLESGGEFAYHGQHD